ncbi:T9SS type A sorting domain-containing protein [Sporocytophaga myxococcoides]|uniref:T9SS type A sorting domain-containing protein n=1 Tax=Sporocytophaga myxococcoides TaxID=153721 RepID=UPI00040C5805|nr:T9SS type A sorting domain-containing protein [Sporocytophaga myxococcoides]
MLKSFIRSPFFYFLFTFFLFTENTWGQIFIRPLEYDPSRGLNKSLRVAAINDTLSLPFFEDFSQNITTSPDLSRWMSGSGTFISQDYAMNPPSVKVATFDGLNAEGMPYNFSIPTAEGKTDDLTSRPINLKSLTPADSVMLSFYWQNSGFGDPSDNKIDSLRLEFKNSEEKWKTVWSNKPPIADKSNFFQKIIPIKDTSFFHGGFQFRFTSYGRQSGSFDIWNIDYIILDSNRTQSDTLFPDAAPITLPTSLLKSYQSMPVNQFVAGGGSAKASSSNVRVHNLGITRTPTYTSYAIDKTTQNILQTRNLQGALIGPFAQATIAWDLDDINVTERTEPVYINQCFAIHSKDTIENGIDFRVNDSICKSTALSDYYAYDDGTAEFYVGSNSAGSRFALKFGLTKPDTITDIEIYFPRVGISFDKQPLTLNVWRSITIGNNNEEVLTSQDIIIEYTSLNTYKRYHLANPVLLSDSFYVGYRQNFGNTYQLGIGFDKNNDNQSHTFVNLGNEWQNFDKAPGTIMIRPVFGKGFPVGNKPPVQELEANVFPNPSTGLINIFGKISKATLYDLSGRVMAEQFYDNYVFSENLMDISHLNNGLYLLHLTDGNALTVKKVLLNK